MNYLVTGGLGFIGSNIAKKLIADGNKVWIIDNLHTGSYENKPEGAAVIEGVAGKVAEMELPKMDAVFHDGIYSSAPMYKEDPTRLAKALDDFLKILDFCRKNDCPLIFASTSSVYNGVEPPQREDAEILPQDLYSETRLYMERISLLYSKLYAMGIAGMRYFSVYGPGERAKKQYANLVSQFLWAMQKDEAPVIYGDGSQTRDLTYVDDVVRANLLAAQKIKGFEALNVGTGKTYTLNEMVGMLNKALGKDIRPKYVENPIKNYVEFTQADTRKAKERIGFEAKVSLEEGIGRLVKLYS
ncbi:MAG: NAD-dependent epimerase/dehydratase family protein [Candidatus Micrarchaeota archaeon]